MTTKKTARKVVKKKVPTKTKTKSKALVTTVVAKPKQTKLAVINAKLTPAEALASEWIAKLKQTKSRMEILNHTYNKILYVLLKETYSVYSEAVKSNLAEKFFGAIWNQLYKNGIKVQKNTPNASLIIRYICGADVATKTVSDYAKVLENADYNNITTEDFLGWLNYKKMNKVIEEQRAIANNIETRSQRMSRARLVIMRLIEARETKPEFSWTTTAWQAEKQISENGLWLGIGNAHRVLDGGHNFNAKMNLIMLLPYNKEMEKRLLNIYAEAIVDSVEKWEKGIDELEESIWAEELWEQLVGAGYEESVKRA